MSLTDSQRVHVNKWLDLLESDTYRQGKSYLKTLPERSDPNQFPQYCCLGVAAEGVCAKQFIPDPEATATSGCILVYKSGDDDQFMTLDLPEQELLGLDNMITQEEAFKLNEITGKNTYYLANRTRAQACMNFNDSLNLSFPEIANIFRELGWNE